MLLVCDAEGTLLWIDGERADARRRAMDVHLPRGARSEEADAGTNAMGTALASTTRCRCSRPSTSRRRSTVDVQRRAAPRSRDRPVDRRHRPGAARSNRASALAGAGRRRGRMVEGCWRARRRTSGGDHADADASARGGRGRAELPAAAARALGVDRALVELGGAAGAVELSRRHSEMLSCSALGPRGCRPRRSRSPRTGTSASRSPRAPSCHGCAGCWARGCSPSPTAWPRRRAPTSSRRAVAGEGALAAALDATYPGPLLPRSSCR